MFFVMIALALLGFVIGVPIAFSFGAATITYLLITDSVPLSLIAQEVFVAYDTVILIAVPLFLYTGFVMTEGGLTERLVDFANSMVGRVRGGLAHVNVISNIIMAGMSGSSMSDAAASGGVLIPAMTKAGYPRAFSAAVTASAATIGPVIPPSIPMLVYASFAEVSIGRAFLAGAIPGLMMGLFFMALCYVIAVRRNFPVNPEPFSIVRLLGASVKVAPVMLLPIIVLGGIVTGAFTATEASGVAAVLALALAAFYTRIRWAKIRQITLNTVVITGAIMIIVGLAKGLATILTRERISAMLVDVLAAPGTHPTEFLIALVVVLLILGCFLDPTPIMVLVLPVALPLAHALQIDLVQLGVIVVLSLMIGLLTPPVGLTGILACSIAGVRMSAFVRECWPFWVAIIAVIMFVVFFPGAILWVPDLLMGSSR